MPSGKEIRSTQRREQRVTLSIDPSLAAGQEIVVGKFKAEATKNGAGDLSIVLKLDNTLVRAPLVMVAGNEVDATGYAENITVKSFDLKITDLAGAAADKKVIVEVIGWYSQDEQ